MATPAAAVPVVHRRAMAKVRAATRAVPMAHHQAMVPIAANALAAVEMARPSETAIAPARHALIAMFGPMVRRRVIVPMHAATDLAVLAAKAARANAETIVTSVARRRAIAKTTTDVRLALAATATAVLKKTRPKQRPHDLSR
jgi:hypothetical protein